MKQRLGRTGVVGAEFGEGEKIKGFGPGYRSVGLRYSSPKGGWGNYVKTHLIETILFVFKKGPAWARHFIVANFTRQDRSIAEVIILLAIHDENLNIVYPLDVATFTPWMGMIMMDLLANLCHREMKQ